MISRRNLLIGLMPFALNGCGFRLKDSNLLAGSMPESLQIDTTDQFSPFIKNLIRQMKNQGTKVVERNAKHTLKLTPPIASKRILGSISGGDQTELSLKLTYSLITSNLTTLIPETIIKSSLIYLDSGSNNSAEDQRIEQFRRSLEIDLLRQIIPSIRARYGKAN